MAIINGSGIDDDLIGTGAGDIIRGLAGNDDISAGNGNDRVLGGSGNDSVFGEAGNDILEGGQGNDRLDGGTGNDRLLGGLGVDRLFGGAGNDILDGGIGADIMRGGSGNDTYIVDNALDRVIELPGEGLDLIEAGVSYVLSNVSFVENLTLTGVGNFDATGNGLDNVLTGNDGDNLLTGGSGLDTLLGGEGNDLLTGGNGADILTGGTGDDIFSFDLVTEGIDTVVDFDPLTDTIQVLAAGFNPVEVQLGSQIAAFRLGAIAGAPTDRFVYDGATGALYFDVDGNGATAQVQFAQLGVGLALTGDNIVAV